jgi:hypothetical protein
MVVFSVAKASLADAMARERPPKGRQQGDFFLPEDGDFLLDPRIERPAETLPTEHRRNS